jgi:long-chain fatty acid transport protein
MTSSSTNTHTHIAAGIALMVTGVAHGAGFALIEQNASGLGNAYAGQAASAQDASTVFFNPAGMSLLPDRQVALAGHFIKPSAEFSGTVSPAIGGNDGGDAGGWAFVPNFYYAHRLSPALTFGIGVNAPFGLATKYDAAWVGRIQGIKSEVKTINVNPSLAFKVSDTLSLGAGLSAQRIDAELTRFTGAAIPGFATVKGDDYGWGWNLGALMSLGKDTRIGVAYRSEVDYTLEGNATFSALPVGNAPITADATLPDTLSVSLTHAFSKQWDVLLDVTWTGWSSFDELRILCQATTAVCVGGPGSTLQVTPENWEDTYRYSVGMNHHMSDKLTLRFGLAFDETPVQDGFRTARVPDEDRTWVAFGGQYRLSQQSAIDFGYAHLFVKDASINETVPGVTLTGSYDSSVDILSAQLTHSF